MDNPEKEVLLSAEDLELLTTKFAGIMVNRLDEFNNQSRDLVLGGEEWQAVKGRYEDIPGPYPKDYHDIFKAIFSRYLASQHIIVPE